MTGERISWERVGLEMVLIPAGSFRMGDTKKEPEFWMDDARPGHPVKLDGFYMDVNEVTAGRFREFVNQSGYNYGGNWNDVALSGYSNAPFQTQGYIIEWGTNFVTAAICNANNADNRLACVNFYLEQELVLADREFRDVKMLDLCDPEP